MVTGMTSHVSGTRFTHGSIYERDTTIGSSAVQFSTDAPANGLSLKENVCSVCGRRSYTVDGICPYQDELLHRVDDVCRKYEV